MTTWPALRGRHRTSRRLVREATELATLVSDGRTARRLARRVATSLETDRGSMATTTATARALATHCADDARRAALAAYLHVVREVPLDDVADVFGVDPAAARRLVERGTGTAPVTSAEHCRGWALVLPRPGRTDAERSAAAGHLALCRHCRNRVSAHHSLEQRVATAGSATLGISVATAVSRVVGGHVAGGAAGAIGLPVAALSTAAALTAGAGALTATLHLGHGSSTPRPVPPAVHVAPGPTSDPATVPGGRVDGVRVSTPKPPAPRVAPTSTPRPGDMPLLPIDRGSIPVDVPTVPPLPLPSLPSLPLPTVSAPSLPVPLPTVSVSLPPLLP